MAVKEKYYSKGRLEEMANLCELMRNDSVQSIRTMDENIAFMFESFGYRITKDGNYFLIERETKNVSDDGYDF